MKLFITLSLLLLVGCESHYRYPCQDPANFGTPDCEPPACEASGMCTKDILPQLDTSTSQVQENGGSQ